MSADQSLGYTTCSSEKILALSFNQDSTAVSVGTTHGYKTFLIKKNDETDLYEIVCDAPPVYLPYKEVKIIERLFSSALFALVTQHQSSKLILLHFRRGIQICANTYPKPIQAVKFNRSRMIVCLEESIYIYNLRDMKIIHKIQDISTNIDGLCSLSPNESNSYLAYPGSAFEGEIQIYNTDILESGILISAHESALSSLSFDISGTKVVSASNKGRVIRIHSAIDGVCLFECEPAIPAETTILSLKLSPVSVFLAASTNTGVIYIFKTSNRSDEEKNQPFATVQSVNKHVELTFTTTEEDLRLFVVDYDGIFSSYQIDTNHGGECELLNRQNIFDLIPNFIDEQTASEQ